MSEVMSPSEAARVLELSTSRVVQLFDSGRLTGEMTPLGRLLDGASVRQLAAERQAATA